MAATSISTTLGVGSGVDFAALTTQLVSAQYQPKLNALTTRNAKLDSQISGVSQLKSGISSFAASVASLVKGGTLSTQPTSSDKSIVNVSALAGAELSGFSASVEVRQLAAAQTAATAPIADRAASVGTGTLTLTLGTATVANGAMTGFAAGSAAPTTIAIDNAHSSLDDIAAAINAAHTGVTASIVSDADGARLSLKGTSGASRAFTLTANEDVGAPGLSSLDVGPGATATTIGSMARDAVVAVDGVALKRSTNAIEDLIPGVKLDLVSASPGKTVTFGASSPGAGISQAVNDFVDTYNSLQAVLKQQTNAATGALYGDTAAKSLSRALSRLTLTSLVSGAAAGAPTTLSDLGVGTNKDGTLSVDAGRLDAAIAKNPAGVEAMFADGGAGATGHGIAATLNAVSVAALDTIVGLGASEVTYTKAQARIGTDQQKIATQEDAMRARLTAQFAATDALVASYKATQDYMKQQVAAWNASGR